jgi:hypothetical protein
MFRVAKQHSRTHCMCEMSRSQVMQRTQRWALFQEVDFFSTRHALDEVGASWNHGPNQCSDEGFFFAACSSRQSHLTESSVADNNGQLRRFEHWTATTLERQMQHCIQQCMSALRKPWTEYVRLV